MSLYPKVTILAVDDEERMLQLIKRSLESLEVEVLTASNKEEAIKILTSHEISIATLDLNLGRDSGLDIFKTIRTEYSKTLCCFVSGDFNRDDLCEIIPLGVYDFITKPFEPKLFKQKINSCIEHQRAQIRQSLIYNRLHIFADPAFREKCGGLENFDQEKFDHILKIMNQKEEEQFDQNSILLVDDEEGIRRLLSKTVKKFGSKTFQAANGQEALEIIKNEPVDLIITDRSMPKMDGLSLFKQARKKQPNLECMLISGAFDEFHLIEAISLGISDFLEKPFFPAMIRPRIENLLKKINYQNKERLFDENILFILSTMDPHQFSNLSHEEKDSEMYQFFDWMMEKLAEDDLDTL